MFYRIKQHLKIDVMKDTLTIYSQIDVCSMFKEKGHGIGCDMNESDELNVEDIQSDDKANRFVVTVEGGASFAVQINSIN